MRSLQWPPGSTQHTAYPTPQTSTSMLPLWPHSPQLFLLLSPFQPQWLDSFDHTRHAFALKPLPSLVALPGMLFPSSMCWKYQGWLTFKSLFTIIFIRSAMTILYSQSSLHSSVFNSAFLLLIYFVLCFLSVSFHWYVRLMKKKSFVCFVHWYISSTSSI